MTARRLGYCQTDKTFCKRGKKIRGGSDRNKGGSPRPQGCVRDGGVLFFFGWLVRVFGVLPSRQAGDDTRISTIGYIITAISFYQTDEHRIYTFGGISHPTPSKPHSATTRERSIHRQLHPILCEPSLSLARSAARGSRVRRRPWRGGGRRVLLGLGRGGPGGTLGMLHAYIYISKTAGDAPRVDKPAWKSSAALSRRREGGRCAVCLVFTCLSPRRPERSKMQQKTHDEACSKS